MVYYGLASRAGKIVCGADAVKESIMFKKVFVVIIAEDASLTTREKFLRYASENNVQAFVFGNIEKKNKAVIAIKDKNFSNAICRIINGGDAIGQN